MAQVGRPGLSIEQKAELWRRWRQGQSISDIGRALGKQAGSIYGMLAANGGLTPRARTRNSRALSLSEREEISRGLAEGESLRAIASRLKRAPSTVSREVARNKGRSRYRATRADGRAWAMARRPKACLLARNKRLRDFVAQKLQEDWSPEQISGWLAATDDGDAEMRVSHETIYRSLYMQARQVLRRELVARLRSRRTMRKGKHSTTAGQRRGQIIDAVSIRDRPAEIDTRAKPGHWEGDLITGAKNSYVATLVERYSRYVMLVRVPGKDTASVVGALIDKVNSLPRGLLFSLTWDRGTELAMHKRFTEQTGVPVYFCDPHSPWQRGTNENTNGLLRQYLPNGLKLSGYSQQDLDLIALRLNRRPRKTLGFLTPRDRIIGAVAPTR